MPWWGWFTVGALSAYGVPVCICWVVYRRDRRKRVRVFEPGEEIPPEWR